MQVLSQARRVEVQRAQKVLIEATKDKKEFDVIKTISKRTIPETEKKHITT